MTISIADAIREGAQIFHDAGLADARREAGGLLQHVIGCDRTFVLAHPEHQLSQAQLQTFQESVKAARRWRTAAIPHCASIVFRSRF